MSHETTLAVQRRLQQDGLYHGNVDGQWGPDSQSALTEFQRRNNLNTTAELDQSTLDALKLNNTGTTTPAASTTEALGSSNNGSSGQSQSTSSAKTQ